VPCCLPLPGRAVEPLGFGRGIVALVQEVHMLLGFVDWILVVHLFLKVSISWKMIKIFRERLKCIGGECPGQNDSSGTLSVS